MNRRHHHLPMLVAATLAALWVLLQLEAPLVEDSLFWWVPKAFLAAERGISPVLAHDLPATILQNLGDGPVPHQWADGLPDYAHPPLWYGWLALFLSVSPTVTAVHLACLLPAIMAAAGFAALGARIGHRWSGLSVLCLPPVLAQFLRPELDLPLLAITPWVLLALIDRRWRRFALLGFLAPLLKEPGVLMVVPAAWVALQDRRFCLAALAPLAGLGSWALVHGGLATPESLPDSVTRIPADLLLAGRIVLVEQGRWLLLLGLPWLIGRHRRPSHGPLVALALVWLVFFSIVGFFAGRGHLEPLTHVRYFLPGMAVGVVLLAQRAPVLALAGLFWLHAASPFGPEASLFGVDAARAERAAAPWIASRVAEGREVWVGSYQGAGLTQPWAGISDTPVRGFRIYDRRVPADSLPPGSILVGAAHGEPTTRFERALELTALDRWTHKNAQVTAWVVVAPR